MAENSKDIADSGRRAFFHSNLTSNDQITKTIRKIENKIEVRQYWRLIPRILLGLLSGRGLRGITYIIPTKIRAINAKIEDDVVYDFPYNESVIDQPELFVKMIQLQYSSYMHYLAMQIHKPRLWMKNLLIWVPLISTILIGLVFGFPQINKIIFYIFTLLALSPLSIKSAFLLKNWEQKTDEIYNIYESAGKVTSLEEVSYLFLEYTMILNKLPSLPNEIYRSIEPTAKEKFKLVISMNND